MASRSRPALSVGGGLGIVIAVVVIVHRFSDGIGGRQLPPGEPDALARRLSLGALVAAAPVLGVLVGSVLTVPDEVLGVMLAFFAGFFLYVGAAELLPEAHRRTARAGSWSPRPSAVRRDLPLLGLGRGHRRRRRLTASAGQRRLELSERSASLRARPGA